MVAWFTSSPAPPTFTAATTSGTTSIWWPQITTTTSATATGTYSTFGQNNAVTRIWIENQNDWRYYGQQQRALAAQQSILQYQAQQIRNEFVEAQRMHDALPAPPAAPAILRRITREQAEAAWGVGGGVQARETNAAARRARELLISFLSDRQQRDYAEHGWFIVVGGRSGRRYRIMGGSYAGNVQLLAANDNSKVEATYCGHCDAAIPLGDQLLAQKVMLEIDEPAYIALANKRLAA